MTKSLVIVESPTKIKTLKKFFGPHFVFESSLGHIRDLPPKKFGIDVDNNFEPEYEILEGKKEVIDRLKKAAKDADIVYLSPDPDREGEAIAWHIAEILPKGTKYKRVTFNEITKEAVKEALAHPKDIDENLVNAQQARRLLDRMVGYKISPILHRKIGRGKTTGSLSAGRVQSVALKLVVDREKEIAAFIPIEYWNLGAHLRKEKDKKSFEAQLYSVNDKRVEKEDSGKKNVFLIPNAKVASEIKAKLDKASYIVNKVEKKEKKRNPVPPFTTSTLQQEASRHHGYPAAKTMSIAQSLYEGVDLGMHGSEGLITYMRTDSVRVSNEAQTQAKEFVKSTYGSEFLPPTPPVYSSKKSAQDAHEAIRPTNINNTPEKIEAHLSREQFKLYQLIWRRFMASQMNPAIYDTVSADIGTDQGLVLRTTGSVVKFQGFLIVYEEKADHEEEVKENAENILPVLVEGEKLSLLSAFSTQSFTKPPPRFTEASLVKELEKSGIGRPSTYASIMGKIQGRTYTTKEKNTLKPTELGQIICQMLEENFPKIMDIQFTANMENDLDKIAENELEWHKFLKTFWKDFYPTVETASKEAQVPKILTDQICPDCGHQLQKIWARGKYFFGCSNYPECKYTAPLEELTVNKEEYAPDFDWEQPCPKCGKEMKIRKSRFGIFLGCSNYPECKGIVNIPKKGDIPADQLPSCPAIGCDGRIVQRRSRFGKSFFSCSNYPDCDVIANSVDALAEKYKDHPKTPYVSKKKAKVEKKEPATKKTATKKTPVKKGAKKETKKASDKKATKEKKPRNQPLYTPSAALAAVVGKDSISRTEVTKKLWDYIKEHNLQDSKNKRKIVPDEKLAKILGQKEPIDMMKLATFISKHLK